MRLEITSSEREEEEDRHFEDIFSAILPNSEAFPMLTDMTLDISAVGFTDRDKGKYVDSRIFIPFSKMPRLRYLVLRTCQSEVDLIPDGMALPSIRTLVLRSCYKIHKNWIVQFLKQMKAQGDLDLLRISIDGCSSLSLGANFRGCFRRRLSRRWLNDDEFLLKIYLVHRIICVFVLDNPQRCSLMSTTEREKNEDDNKWS